MSDSIRPLTLAVPVYNAEEFLPATLESLNAQGEHVRWWLQDGASKDRTVEIARAFARPCDTIVSEPDSGQPDALNRAFAKMGGDIIGFINGDDILTPGTAERVVKYFEDHPELDLIYGRVEWMDSKGATTGRHSGRIQSLEEVLDIYGVWWSQRQWVQPEVFFRRSLWEKTAGFQPKWNLAFDYDFWVRCLRAGARVAYVHAVGARFRIHSAQKSSASEKAADDIRGIVSEHLDNGAEISPLARQRLRAHLSYDLYQLGKTTAPGKRRTPFAMALLRNPRWFLCPAVRARAKSSLAKLLGFRRRTKA